MTAALYHAALVGRAKAGIGKGRLAQPDATVTLDNPLCGDRVTLDVTVSNGLIDAIGHQVRGCLLCEAAAATIAESCKDKSVATARSILSPIRALIRDGTAVPDDWVTLDIFSPVHDSKSRRDCVLLPFTAFEQALDQLA